MFTMVKFSEWLDIELDARGWTRAELARRSGLNQSTISMAYSGQRNVGKDLATAIAKGLELPITVVLRAAGIIPKEPEYVPLYDEWNAIFFELTPEDQQEMLEIAKLKASRNKKNVKTTSSSQGKKEPGSNCVNE